MRFIAPTLDEAYQKAAKEFSCSVVELEIEVIQNPSSGFLGIFSKDAIIEVSKKGAKNDLPKKEEKVTTVCDSKENLAIEKEIRESLERLLKSSCYRLSVIETNIEDDTVYIKLDGEDAALMIGKEGYRYKAISYILHNWIKMKYDMAISLEIAEFLKNQKENVINYLENIKQRVKEQGRAQTKPLDGILVKIALEELRALYPDMYVAIKTLRDGRKVVVVNEHRK